LAATCRRSAACVNREPQGELPARIFDFQEIDGRPHRRDRSKKVAEQLISNGHADLCRVTTQSALTTLRAL
jgi:hypothetical protein